MLKCAVQVYVQKLSNTVDEVAEWLRRWTANPMDSVRVGSSPIFVVISQRKASDSRILCYEKLFGRAKNLHSFI